MPGWFKKFTGSVTKNFKKVAKIVKGEAARAMAGKTKIYSKCKKDFKTETIKEADKDQRDEKRANRRKNECFLILQHKREGGLTQKRICVPVVLGTDKWDFHEFKKKVKEDFKGTCLAFDKIKEGGRSKRRRKSMRKKKVTYQKNNTRRRQRRGR